MQLSIVKSEQFGTVQCDFWRNDNGEVFMTIAQLALALGYADRSGIDKIVQRNEYLTDREFSVQDKMSGTDGKQYETRIFTEDGIYEVTMLSKTKVAREFRAWVRKVLKSLRRGEAVLTTPVDKFKQMELEIKRMNAEARLLNARYRQAMLVLKSKEGKTLSPQSVELIEINALEVLTDRNINYRPETDGKLYSATDISKETGVPRNTIGKIAKANGLQTSEFGIWALDKSPYSDKQVQSFRYNERGRQKLRELVKGSG